MKNKPLSIFTLAMLITVSIDSIRNLPATALFGSNIIFFFVVAALFFLLPTALISAELSASFTEKSGIYHWVKQAFGNSTGFIAIWLQWVNTLVWYPTILSFIAGTLIYIIDPALANSKMYLISVILLVFWSVTLINLKGIQTSARFASVCAVGGMIAPVMLIIGLGLTWILTGHPLQLHFSTSHLVPHITHSQSWISLTAIITAFLGMELATVHVKRIDQPQKNFPKAIFIAVIIITLTMILGSLSISLTIPQQHIQLVNGVMQTFTLLLKTYHLSWLLPFITVMLLLGSTGGMINWIISPAQGLLQACEEGYVSKRLQKTNKNQVPSTILLLQAVIVTLTCLAFYLMPSVNGSYWLLTDLSTEIYLMMYILMFIAALRLKHRSPLLQKNKIIPGKKIGFWLVSLLGLIGCCIAIVVGFIPPSNINVGSQHHYEVTFTLGIAIMLLPAILVIVWRKIQHFRRNTLI